MVNFRDFVKNIFKNNILSQIAFSFFKKNSKNKKKKLKKYANFFHNCLQYELILKIVYFHILNIFKFG
jgi:hypothetical protein